MTNKELWEHFMQRDNQAIQEMNNWMRGPITEGRRLEFVEGRLQDICVLVGELIKNLENDQRTT